MIGTRTCLKGAPRGFSNIPCLTSARSTGPKSHSHALALFSSAPAALPCRRGEVHRQVRQSKAGADGHDGRAPPGPPGPPRVPPSSSFMALCVGCHMASGRPSVGGPVQRLVEEREREKAEFQRAAQSQAAEDVAEREAERRRRDEERQEVEGGQGREGALNLMRW